MMYRKTFVAVFMLLFIFGGCARPSSDLVPDIEKYISTNTQELSQTDVSTSDFSQSSTLPQLQQHNQQTDEETQYSGALPFKGVWVSYYELAVYGRSESEYREYIASIFDSLKKLEITDVFVHVRPYADSIYASDFFPSSDYVASEQGGAIPFDVLGVFLDFAQQYNMNIHAWLNPYRATFSSDTDDLAEGSKTKKWIEEGSDNIALIGERYYLNPASEEVKKLIIDGAAEILQKYPAIKGIHIDDYFYPENCGDFDAASYDIYKGNGGMLSLSDWRRENVNSLVKGIYAAVKNYGNGKIFSVSPSGNIERNRDEIYADTEKWCKGGYCDMMIPQIYYGFNNESQPFASTVDRWISLCENSDTELVIGLALYKCGQVDEYAGEKGQNEWTQNTQIIKRQAEYIKNKNLPGFCLFSTSYINFSESFLKNELEGLKSVY